MYFPNHTPDNVVRESTLPITVLLCRVVMTVSGLGSYEHGKIIKIPSDPHLLQRPPPNQASPHFLHSGGQPCPRLADQPVWEAFSGLLKWALGSWAGRPTSQW